VIYEGEFKKGQFHGEGVLIYPNGGKFKGRWSDGKLTDGGYEFKDGLEFDSPPKWNFCTYKDRRFYHEIIHDIKNPDVNSFNGGKLFRNIPEATYDVGDGFYDPEKGTIFTYENQFLRIPNEHEVNLFVIYHIRKSGLN
jgi:hypothetical protein